MTTAADTRSGRARRMRSSMGTGATFFPPEVTISSFRRPRMKKKPEGSRAAYRTYIPAFVASKYYV